jgi:hypothetical protein
MEYRSQVYLRFKLDVYYLEEERCRENPNLDIFECR